MRQHVLLERDFLAFINDKHLFNSADRVLLAVSGGIDSMVMADLFGRIKQPFAVAHVNFGLRGAESDEDARFVENKTEQYGVPFHLIRFDTKQVAKERGISVQMAARELRYDWFRELLHQYGYACVATAHHQNDVLETVLLNLTRGTGLAGLHGLASRQQDVVRPLLFATRETIAAYAQQQSLVYREDSSNQDDKYARNRIRHQVVPTLLALNPGFWQTFPRTIERLQSAESLMQQELRQSWSSVTQEKDDRILLPTDKLIVLSELAFRLSEWLKPFGFTETQAKQMTTTLGQSVGQVFASSTHRIIHERTGLVLEPLREAISEHEVVIRQTDTLVQIGNRWTLTVDNLEKPTPFMPAADKNVTYLDADRLIWPLAVRLWRQGDRFRPLGLNGNKLVSDLLNDLKLSRSEREQTHVLLSGNQIAWVVGQRIGHPFRITPETLKMTRFIWSRKNDPVN